MLSWSGIDMYDKVLVFIVTVDKITAQKQEKKLTRCVEMRQGK